MTPISHRLFAAAATEPGASRKTMSGPAKGPVIEVARRTVVSVWEGVSRPAPSRLPSAAWAGVRVN
jgi:hypothetical protein